LAVACAALLSCARDASAASLTYGVAAGSHLLPSGIGQLAPADVTVFRMNAPWDAVQPSAPPAAYNWTSLDAEVTTLAQNGLTWLPIAMDSPSWQQTIAGNNWSIPASPAAYGTFVEALVERYGPNGTFWQQHPTLPYRPVQAVEIWNEPNDGFLQPQDSTTPGKYYDMYKAARDDVHQVDPSVKLILGGLADAASVPDMIPWLQQMQASRPGALSELDSVGWHPYWPTLAQNVSQLQALRTLLDQNGGSNTPISITEAGYPSLYGTSEDFISLMSSLAGGLPSSGCDVDLYAASAWQEDSGGTLTADSYYTLSLGTGQLTAPGAAFVSLASNPPSQSTGWCQSATPPIPPTPPTPPAPPTPPVPPIPPKPPPPSTHPRTQKSVIAITGTRVSRGRLTVSVAIDRGQGTLHASASRARRMLRLQRHGTGRRFTFTGRLTLGRWRIVVGFVPVAGWSAVYKQRTVILRTRPARSTPRTVVPALLRLFAGLL
jgi:hypothetical protein